MLFPSRMRRVLYFTALVASTCSFSLNGYLNLSGYNFAFLGSFCGNASGPVIEYWFSYPQENCCYNFLSYFQDQWRKIWPKPEMSCKEKANVLTQHQSQVLTLSTNNSVAGCQVVSSQNGTNNITCQGSQIYQVQTEDVYNKKCWFLAVTNRNCTVQGIQITYSFNITGAIPNMAPKRHHGNLLTQILSCLIITWSLLAI